MKVFKVILFVVISLGIAATFLYFSLFNSSTLPKDGIRIEFVSGDLKPVQPTYWYLISELSDGTFTMPLVYGNAEFGYYSKAQFEYDSVWEPRFSGEYKNRPEAKMFYFVLGGKSYLQNWRAEDWKIYPLGEIIKYPKNKEGYYEVKLDDIPATNPSDGILKCLMSAKHTADK